MRYILLPLLIFFQVLFANSEFTTTESSVFEKSETASSQKTDILDKQNTQVDYLSEIKIDFVPTSKNLYLSYIKFPKNIYKNQRFEINVKALITTDDFDNIVTRFVDSKNMNVLNPSKEWLASDSNTYENTYFFKAYEEDFNLPTFQVLLYKDQQLVEFAYLKPEETRFSSLAKGDDTFSNIIAKGLKVTTYKTKQYNNKEFLTIIDIDAKESNLEDFYLKNYGIDQGISLIEDNYPIQHILYYLITPIHKKKIEFTYYNTTKNGFETISLPLKLENELVSTQTDLNPNNSNFEFYKKIALLSVLLIFVILFIWKRKYIYLFVAFLLAALAILYLMPNKKAFVKLDSRVYILPTKKSTIFYNIDNRIKAEILNNKDGFMKIMFIDKQNNKIIGWIKEENIVKN